MTWMIPVLLLLCSGSVLAAAYGRRAEEAMPITAGAATLLLYAAYAADRLPIGYAAVLAAGVGCYAVASYIIIYNIQTRGVSLFGPSEAIYHPRDGDLPCVVHRDLDACTKEHRQRMG